MTVFMMRIKNSKSINTKKKNTLRRKDHVEGRRILFWWFGLAFERLCHEMEIVYNKDKIHIRYKWKPILSHANIMRMFMQKVAKDYK